jgi:hypothetical protein
MPRFADILQAITTQLVTAKVVPDASRIKVTVRDPRDVPFNDSELDILLRVRGFDVDQQQYEGAGRYFCRVNRTLEIIPRTRDAKDAVDEDLAWVTEETFGHLAAEDAIYTALVEPFWPTAADGVTLLTITPIYLTGCGDPVRKIRGAGSVDWTWGYSSLRWMIPYQQPFAAVPNA